jgi:hypothetical protein
MVFKGCGKQINSQTVAPFMIIIYILQTAKKTQLQMVAKTLKIMGKSPRKYVPHGKKKSLIYIQCPLPKS